MVLGTDRYKLRGDKEAGGRDNNDTGVGIRRGVGRGSKRGLGRRGGISGSERVKCSVMEWGVRVIHQDRQREGNKEGGRRCSSKNINLKRDIV